MSRIFAYNSEKLIYSSDPDYMPKLNYNKYWLIGEFEGEISLCQDSTLIKNLEKVNDRDSDFNETLVFLNEKRDVVFKILVPCYTNFTRLNSREVMIDYRYMDKNYIFLMDVIDMMKKGKRRINVKELYELDFFKTTLDGHCLSVTIRCLEDNTIYYNNDKTLDIIKIIKTDGKKERKTIVGFGSKEIDQLLIIKKYREDNMSCYGISKTKLETYTLRCDDTGFTLSGIHADEFDLDRCWITAYYAINDCLKIDNFIIIPSFFKSTKIRVKDRSEDVMMDKLTFYGKKDDNSYLRFMGVLHGYYLVRSFSKKKDEICIYNCTKKELIIIPKQNLENLFSDDFEFNKELDGNQKIVLEGDKPIVWNLIKEQINVP